MRFRQEDGEWVSEWDSTQLVHSSMLPLAVEISLSLASDDPAVSEVDFLIAEPTARVYTLRVALPQPPLDLAAMLDPEAIQKRQQGAGAAAGTAGDNCPSGVFARSCLGTQEAQEICNGPRRIPLCGTDPNHCLTAQELATIQGFGLSCQ
jgi:hypothetical protein